MPPEVKNPPPAPTPGRIVLYRSAETDQQQVPAMVTQVNPDGTVDLFVMAPHCHFHAHGTHEDDSGALGTWSWPPRAGK